MIDLTSIVMAADQLDRKQGKACSQQVEHLCFPRQTQTHGGFPSFFEARDTKETGFRGGVRSAPELHPDCVESNTPSPLPPWSSLKRAEPPTSLMAVSFVSHERESQCQQGITGDLCGKHHHFPSFPTFPVASAEVSNSTDRMEALEERAAILEFDAGMPRNQAEAACGLGFDGSFLALPIAGNPRRDVGLGSGSWAYATHCLNHQKPAQQGILTHG